MKRTLALGLLILLLAAAPLSGCSDFKEINELALVDMVGVDVDEEGLYHSYYQVVNPNGVAGTKAGGSRSPLYTFEFKGKTWAEFITLATQTVPRQLFISHFQAYVISEKLAKRGIRDLLNFLESDPTRRIATAVFITKSPVRDVMNTYVPLESNPGRELRNIQKLQFEVTGNSDNESQIKDMMENIESPRLTFVSNIELNDQEAFDTAKRFQTIEGNKGNFSYIGASIIKQGRWIGELTNRQLVPLFLTLGRDRLFIEDLNFGGHSSAQLQLIGKPRRICRFGVKNGKAALRITIKPELRLLSINDGEKLDSRLMKELEQRFNRQLEGQMEDLLRLGRQRGWDLLGIEDRIGHQSGKKWASLKADPSSWTRADVRINIRSRIVQTGVMLTPYRGES